VRDGRGRILLKLILLIMATALIQPGIWADPNHGATLMLALLLLTMLADHYVPSQPMPARHRHQTPRGRGPA
jgi:hypothetical protein